MTKGEILQVADNAMVFPTGCNDVDLEQIKENTKPIDDVFQQIGPQCPNLVDSNNNNNNIYNTDIVSYVANTKNPKLKRQLTRICSEDNPGDIDIENIEDVLKIAKSANSRNTLKCCEEALISHLSPETRDFCLNLANKYDLPRVRHEASDFPCVQPSCPAALEPCPCATNNHIFEKDYQSYISLFTCNTCSSNRSVSVLVYDSRYGHKVAKDLKKGRRISKNFQCCCVQADCRTDPLIFWSFGESVYRYDPLLNKCKKRASLRSKRSKFNLVAYGHRCFAIGGVYQIRKVLDIEEFNAGKGGNNSWKKVATLPGDSVPVNPSSVVCNGMIYIFSAILDINGELNQSSTAVYVFNPMVYTVKHLTDIPVFFNQMKTCAIDSNIYIASDAGHMVQFTPSNCSVTSLPNQISECRDFGMYSLGSSIILTGGSDRDGKCNNTFRKFCTIEKKWEVLSYKLPDYMVIDGVCDIKIPNTSSAIVPFYDVNLFGKR